MNIKKILIITISLILFSINVYADSTIDINKRLNGMQMVDENVTFTYEVTPINTNPTDVNFSDNTFTISFDSNSIIKDRIAYSKNTLNFSTINFTKPGNYRFKVSEISSSNQNVYPKDNNYYIITLNVINEVDENNNPNGNLVVDVSQSGYLNDTTGKGEILFETTPLTYITLSKSVTGDMGDINEYFKFKITIDGDGYSIYGQDSSVTYNNEVINTINTYDANSDNYVYLKHGQTITIGNNNGTYQIPCHTLFTIEEMDASNYKTFINKSNTDRKDWQEKAYNTISSNTVSYVNNYESSVLTGVFVNIIPYILMISLSIIGIYVIKKKNKKTNNN